LGDRWPEVARTYAEVNFAFGDIVKVTPSSKVVGDMAIFLVSRGMSVADFQKLGPDHQLSLPNSVVDMFMGSLGIPEGGWPPHIQEVVLRGAKPLEGRPGALLPAVDFEVARKELAAKIDREPARDELLSYLMYPEVFVKFDRAHASYSDLEVLPSTQFFYGMEKGDEITVEIEPGKLLVIKFLTTGEPHPDGQRTVFFELNGRPREVDVQDRGIRAAQPKRTKADPNKPEQVGSPLPGLVTAVTVAEGSAVKKGDRLLVLEAMKMQSTVYAPVDGTVGKILAQAGQQVEAKDLLVELVRSA
jgi:pyruvate carboxylase